MKIAARHFVLAAAGAALLLRLGISARDINVLDRSFIPDDTYYVLQVARSLARGLGPTVDGHTLTNGFQPLLVFLMTPVFWAGASADTALRVVLVLSSLADALSVLFLGGLLLHLGRPTAARVATVLWALSPIAVANALSGLETSLALLLQIGTLWFWVRIRQSDGTRGYPLLGAVVALGVLARVDAAFLALVLLAIELFQKRFRQVVYGVGAGLVILAPIAGYSVLHFGTPVPESGPAVIDIVAMHRDLYLDAAMQMGWSAGTLIGSPIVEMKGLKEVLFELPELGGVVWLAVIALIGWTCFGRERLSKQAPVLALGIHAASILAFYTFCVPALWFFRRYLEPCHLLFTLLIALGVDALDRRYRGHARARALLVLVSASLVAIAGLGSVRYLYETPSGSIDESLHGAKGYREAAKSALGYIPRGSTVGALQSGALSYYGDGAVEVVNLDGVVDSAAHSALRERRLADYARDRRIDYLVDWEFNIQSFLRGSERASQMPTSFELVGRAIPQGGDRFLIYRVRWTPANDPS